MRTFALRVLALGSLVFLYVLNPFAGIVVLAAGFGYVMAQRRRRSLEVAPRSIGALWGYRASDAA